MKRFRFAPEALLTLRRHALKEQEARLAAIEGRRAEALRTAQELESQSCEARASIDDGALLRGADLQCAAMVSEGMLARARGLLELAKGLERERAAARRKVLRARRDVETLQQLRERSLAEWRRDAQREEETLAGELFLARFARRDDQ